MSQQINPFLQKLNEKITIQEGPEGFRTIFRIIYREGHISVADLAYETLIPIPVLAKIVNYLVEKDILGRIPEGILFTDNGMQYVEQELGFYGFGVVECDICVGEKIYVSPRWDELFDFMEKVCENRPTVDTQLDQAYALPKTSIQRALYIYRNGALEGKKIAFLGDDDFTSVATANLYKGVEPQEPKLIPEDLYVFDIDNRILAAIQKSLEIKSNHIHLCELDYIEPIPPKFQHIFDSVVVDPPYTDNGLILALSRCITLLRREPGAEIYLSFAHKSFEAFFRIQQIFQQMGLCVMEIIPQFNQYEGAQILGNTTQMIRLITTKVTKSLLAADEKCSTPIYTGELNPTIRYYYCGGCSKLISVGRKEEIHTIEQLKAKGCPFCHAQGPFELDDKEEESEDGMLL